MGAQEVFLVFFRANWSSSFKAQGLHILIINGGDHSLQVEYDIFGGNI